MFGLKRKAAAKATPKKVNWHIENASYWVQGQQILDQAHTLIAGATGCGKSTLIHRLMYTALAETPHKTQFVLLDMKGGVELGRYARLPHTIRFARDYESAVSALDWVTAEMHRRVDILYTTGQTLWSGSDIYVVIDELAFLLQCGGSAALNKLTHISQQGRAARIHLILATQDPSKGYGIPAPIQQNMTCRVGLKCDDAAQSRQIIKAAGCELLPDHGQALLKIGAKTTLIGVTPEGEARWQQRINYWLSDRCHD